MNLNLKPYIMTVKTTSCKDCVLRTERRCQITGENVLQDFYARTMPEGCPLLREKVIVKFHADT